MQWQPNQGVLRFTSFNTPVIGYLGYTNLSHWNLKFTKEHPSLEDMFAWKEQ